jgi:IS30 family transposase
MLTLSCVLENKTSAEVLGRMEALVEDIPKESVKSITFDNGTEFTEHYKLGVQTYFCDPYSPWQKPGVENTNGRLRSDLPRWLDVKSLSDEDFDEIIENYNTTPRKKLGFMTPLMVFQKNLHSVALRS